jgi:hypothetical protein
LPLVGSKTRGIRSGGRAAVTEEALANGAARIKGRLRQVAIDNVIATDLRNVRSHGAVNYVEDLRSANSGKALFGRATPGGGIEIGASALQNLRQLRETLVHEDLHMLWFGRGIRDHHANPRIGRHV